MLYIGQFILSYVSLEILGVVVARGLMIVLVLFPAIVSDIGNSSTIFIINLIASSIQLIYILIKIQNQGKDYNNPKGQTYFRPKDNCVFLLAVCILIPADAINIYTSYLKEEQIQEIYYIWSIASLSIIYPLYVSLKENFIFGKLMDTILYAIKRVWPFLYVIMVNYCMFAVLGCYVFGGSINSKTREVYNKLTNSSLNPNYENLNWNDLPNSFVFLYTINMNNQMIALINMSSLDVETGEKGYGGLFFLAFVIMNNMLYFNIFVGLVIGVGIEKSKQFLEEFKTRQESQRDTRALNSSIASFGERYFDNNGIESKSIAVN